MIINLKLFSINLKNPSLPGNMLFFIKVGFAPVEEELLTHQSELILQVFYNFQLFFVGVYLQQGTNLFYEEFLMELVASASLRRNARAASAFPP